MNHLTPDELVDLVDGTLQSSRHAHLDGCPACRGEADRLGAVLTEARLIAVPEPSPLFWDHFSRRVHAAIADEPAIRPSPGWLRWPVLTPIAAMALLVVALITAVPRTPAPVVSTVAEVAAVPAAIDLEPQSELEPENADDSAWTFIVESVGPLDVETARQAGIAAAPGEAERAALHLTDAEQAELVRLLEQELTRSGS